MVGSGAPIETLTQRRAGTGWELPERLEGRALRLAQVSWIVVAVVVVSLVTAGLVLAYRDPLLVAMPPLTDLFVELGLDFRLMMTIALAFPFVVSTVISTYVFARRPDDPMVMLFTLAILTLYGFGSRSLLAFEGTALEWSLSVLFGLVAVLLMVLLALFPNGRSIPPWSRWLGPAMLLALILIPDAGSVLMELLEGGATITTRSRALVAGFTGLVGAGLFAQVHRYRNVSSPIERQQTKWVVLPLGLLFTIFLTALTALVANPSMVGTWTAWVLFAAIPISISLPLGVANAVLRHRLYDIDRIISRTVSYGLVIAVLGAVYALGVLGVGSLVSAAAPGAGSNNVILAGSVLAVAALFRPVSTRIHRAVDRRFNRVRYESQLVLEDFTHRLQHGADLDQLRADLEQTVEDAFQPASLGVWMADESS